MKQKVILIVGLIAAAIIVYLMTKSFTYKENQEEYLKAVQGYRTEKDQFFLTSKETPIEDPSTFDSLNYYKPDINYKVTTDIELTNDTTVYKINMSNGKQESFIRYATVDFKLKNKSFSLYLFKHQEDGPEVKSLFLPFTDLTNGKETYGGGRYLDVDVNKGNTVTLDFNLAYNPYCAYNPNYICPVPPKENHMDIEVPVGEKNFEEHD
jgi:uncharacterized protein (DUF1684 family)